MTDGIRPRLRAVGERARSAIVRCGASATVVAGLLSLCGFLASRAWPFELLCHFRVQYSLLFLTVAIVMSLFREWRWAGAAAVLMVVNTWELFPYYVEAPVPRSGNSVPGLRVVSANLFRANSEPVTTVEFLQQCDADVIAVYEVTPAWERRLTVSLSGYPHRRVQPEASNFGIALYSRLPFVAAQFEPLSGQNLAIQAEFVHGGERVHLIAAHTCPPGGGRTELRDRQLASLGDLCGELAGPLIVVGDLNITPFSPSFQALCRAEGLIDARRGSGIQPTWPAGRPLLAIPIDHGLVSEHWRSRVVTGPDIGSDHLPLILDVELH